MKNKMRPRQFTVHGGLNFEPKHPVLSPEYEKELKEYGEALWSEEKVTDDEDLKQKEVIKNDILNVLGKTRHDSVHDAVVSFLSNNPLHLKRCLNSISTNLGKNYVRIASFDYFSDKLTYEDYLAYMTNESG
jgi:hypothetical protein